LAESRYNERLGHAQEWARVMSTGNARLVVFLKVATENFAVLSATAVVFGVTTAALFTTGYLSVFNPSLIWLVEYSDLLKVGIAASLFFVAFLYIYDGYIGSFFALIDDNSTRKRKMIHGFGILLLLTIIFGPNIYFNWNNSDIIWQDFYIIFSILLLVTLIIKIKRVHTSGFTDISDILSTGGLFAFLMTTCGAVFGYHIRNDTSLRETVFLDDRVIYNAAVVLVTDKFAVLFQDDKSVVVYPSARVREILGKAGH
jgi:hypothetical protein